MTDQQCGYADSTVLCDVEIECVDCPDNFWWTVGEQEFFDDMGFVPPKRCEDCRAKKKARRADQPESSTALVPEKSRRKSTGPVPSMPELPPLPRLSTRIHRQRVPLRGHSRASR